MSPRSLLRRAGLHADAAPNGDEPVFLEGLIGLGDRQRIGALIGGEGADGGKRVTLLDASIKDHRDDLVTEAEINGAIRGCHCVMLW